MTTARQRQIFTARAMFTELEAGIVRRNRTPEETAKKIEEYITLAQDGECDLSILDKTKLSSHIVMEARLKNAVLRMEKNLSSQQKNQGWSATAQIIFNNLEKGIVKKGQTPQEAVKELMQYLGNARKDTAIPVNLAVLDPKKAAPHKVMEKRIKQAVTAIEQSKPFYYQQPYSLDAARIIFRNLEKGIVKKRHTPQEAVGEIMYFLDIARQDPIQPIDLSVLVPGGKVSHAEVKERIRKAVASIQAEPHSQATFSKRVTDQPAGQQL